VGFPAVIRVTSRRRRDYGRAQCRSKEIRLIRSFFHTDLGFAQYWLARYTGALPETRDSSHLEVLVTRFKFAPGVFLVLAILFVPSLAPAAFASSDKDAITAMLERGRKAFDTHDVNAVMANYAPGDQLFVFDVIPPREYPSWEAYKKDWQELFGEGRDNLQVDRADDGCVPEDRREVADRARTCFGAGGSGDGQGGFAVEAVRMLAFQAKASRVFAEPSQMGRLISRAEDVSGCNRHDPARLPFICR